jgi:hypothetical protein
MKLKTKKTMVEQCRCLTDMMVNKMLNQGGGVYSLLGLVVS